MNNNCPPQKYMNNNKIRHDPPQIRHDPPQKRVERYLIYYLHSVKS